MHATLTGFCPEDSLVTAVYNYSKGTISARLSCNPCYNDTVHQPRLLDLVGEPMCQEQPSAEEWKSGIIGTTFTFKYHIITMIFSERKMCCTCSSISWVLSYKHCIRTCVPCSHIIIRWYIQMWVLIVITGAQKHITVKQLLQTGVDS